MTRPVLSESESSLQHGSELKSNTNQLIIVLLQTLIFGQKKKTHQILR